jgi:sterol desaturase/sphingolipid hydroxylase (fatty acid hydroxylase superfamily)
MLQKKLFHRESRSRPSRPQSRLAFLFPKDIYASESFVDDIKINLGYIVSGFVTLKVTFTLQAAVALSVGKFWLLVFRPFFDAPSIIQAWPLLAVTMVFALTSDFANFFSHYLLHRIPTLWTFHKVHHAADHLTPLTQFRSHPVEPMCREIVTGFVNGTVGAGLLQLGVFELERLPEMNFFAVYIVYYLTIHFRHSHHWVSFGPLSYIFNSPAMHQIHHSIEVRHREKNYGIVFSFWDLLFGSFYSPKEKEVFRIGLEDPAEQELYRGL